MENISKHLSYREVTFSSTAIRAGIDNTPTPEQLKNIKEWAEHIFERVRIGLGGRPVRATIFRSLKLNKIIPGASPTSDHTAIKGAAGDLDNDNNPIGPTNREIFYYIYDNLEFDQLIWEYGTDENPDWVHVGWRGKKNRNQVLRKYSNQKRYKLFYPPKNIK